MKVAVVLAIVLAAVVARAESLKLGDAIPSASVKMQGDGKAVSLADVKGAKGTLVVFSCLGCPYVVAWEERIVSIGNAARQAGVGAVLIDSNYPTQPGDSPEAVAKRAKKCGCEFPYVVDNGAVVAKAFGARVTPEAFLFNAAGQLVYHGTIDDNHKDAAKVEKHFLKDAVDQLAAGKEIAVKESKAIGCGVKYPKKS